MIAKTRKILLSQLKHAALEEKYGKGKDYVIHGEYNYGDPQLRYLKT